MSIVAHSARWVGFGFGYTVAEAVALAGAGIVGGPRLMLLVGHLANIVFLFVAIAMVGRGVVRAIRARKGRAAGPLGTYAKSDSHASEGGGADPGAGAIYVHHA